MFKLSGAALIITACTYYGFYLSSNLYMRTRIIQSLITEDLTHKIPKNYLNSILNKCPAIAAIPLLRSGFGCEAGIAFGTPRFR